MTKPKVQVCVDFLGDDYLVVSGAQNQRKDKRKFERVSIVQEVECEGPKGKYSKRLADISLGGMFVEGMTDFEPGALIRIRFDLGGAEGPIAATARIVYVQQGFGIGVQFVDLEPEDRARLKDALSKLTFLKRHINGKSGKVSRVIAKVPVTFIGTGANGVNFEEKTEILALSKNGVSVRITRAVNMEEPVFIHMPKGPTFEGRASWLGDEEVWIQCRSIAHELGFRFP